MLLRLFDVPILGRLLWRRFNLHEAYSFWERQAKGFAEPSRDLVAEDVTDRARRNLIEAVESLVTPRRPWFMAKLTGWSRIGYLREVFPDARFVHLVRDGRDVANSLLTVPFWEGWKGPRNWRFGPLPHALRDDWERYDQSFVALAGLCWKIVVNATEEAARGLPSVQYLRVRYEDFVAEPEAVLRTILTFADMEYTDAVRKQVEGTPVFDATGKHRRDLTVEQQAMLDDLLGDELRKFGYL